MDDVFRTEVEAAVQHLKDGKVILYPTDTVWGLGCDATNAAAVQKIFHIKQRDDSKSMILLVGDERDVLQYVAAPEPAVFDFLEQQSRPTTVIFDNAIGLPDNVIAPDGSIALRIVHDEFCRHLVRRLGRPLVSTSANISGSPAPSLYVEISEAIRAAADHIVKWRQEDTQPAAPSRVIKWDRGGITIIRG